MSKSTKSPVSAKVIREAFRNGTLDVAKVVDGKGDAVNPVSVLGANGDATRCRGRLNPAFAAYFVENTPGTSYAEKVAEVSTIEVPLNSPKTGRPIKPVTLPVSEVRALAGISGKAGRISKADLAKAGEAFQARKA